ncbi:MAG: type II secretion system protein [Parcubacteria group bacterium]|nr:type II secretion system protein [Parcubacteria group bacterium]
MMKKLRQNQSGFTLAEIVVTMAIFTTAVTTLANIFLYANRSQRKTQAVQESQTDARFAMEVLAQAVRRGTIDYVYYGGAIAANPQAVLAILDASGNSLRFRRTDAGGRGILEMSQDGGTSWSTLTPPGVSVNALSFYLSPSTDPFATNPTSDDQPLVTIALHTTNTSGEGESLAPTFLQTTISSRQYLR